MNSPSNYNLIWQCHILLGTSFEWFYHGCSVSARCASGNCCKEASVWGPAHRTETSEMAAPKPQFLKHQPHGRTKSHPVSLSNLAPVLSEQCCPEGFWCYSLDSAYRYPFYSVSCRLPICQKNVGMFWVDFSLFPYSTYPYSRGCRGTSPACLPAVRSGAFCALLVLIVKGLWSSSGQFGSVLETGSHTKATAVISVVVGRLVLIILFACELHVWSFLDLHHTQHGCAM